jgi:hypothetical protein
MRLLTAIFTQVWKSKVPIPVVISTDLANVFLSTYENRFRENYEDAEAYVNKYNPIQILTSELWGYQVSGATGHIFVREVL